MDSLRRTLPAPRGAELPASGLAVGRRRHDIIGDSLSSACRRFPFRVAQRGYTSCTLALGFIYIA